MSKMLLISLLLMTGCAYLKMFPDNPIEEAAEDFIYEQTGAKVDITGDSPEE